MQSRARIKFDGSGSRPLPIRSAAFARLFVSNGAVSIDVVGSQRQLGVQRLDQPSQRIVLLLIDILVHIRFGIECPYDLDPQ